MTDGKREHVRSLLAPCLWPLPKGLHARRAGPRCASASLFLAERRGELELADLIVIGRLLLYRFKFNVRIM